MISWLRDNYNSIFLFCSVLSIFLERRILSKAIYTTTLSNIMILLYVDFQKNFISQLEVYMDDFIAMPQYTSSAQLNHIYRRLLHAIHCVFPPPSISKHRGLDPISINKLEQGEGLWEFCKIILGWLFDGIERTITLPTEKLNLIAKELKAVYRKKVIPLQRFHQLVGKLRLASFAIPTGKG